MRGQRLQARLAVMESIHSRIKSLRDAKGLSQEALGDLVGVKYQSVQEWERENGTAPSRKRMADVAKALGVTVSQLVTGEAPQAQQPSAAYEAFSNDERALIARYRAADPRWQLSLRLLAALATADQREVAGDVNIILARVFGKRPVDIKPVSSQRVRKAYGDAPHVAARQHEVFRVSKSTPDAKKGRAEKARRNRQDT